MKIRMVTAAALAMSLAAAAAIAGPPSQRADLDLAKAFKARSPWRLVVTEGEPTEDYGGNDAPGALTLCLRKGAGGPCVSAPVTPPARAPSDAPAWEPHYLLEAKVVQPQGADAAPLLLIVTGSLNAGNGDQIVATQLVAYDAGQDAFRRVYARSTGRNNNQQVRFVAAGSLRGSVISAEPQAGPPYGYWIEVESPTAAGAYRQVLRYASATRYNDGNSLAVIDSEMPNIQRRLGLWKPGQPIPTPAGKPCSKPTLRRNALWCE